jgi:hypothetical protein
MRNLPGPILLALAALAACSRSSPQRADSTASASATSHGASGSPPGTAASSSTPMKSGCPRTGMWALCSLEIRLGQSGFVVRRVGGEVKRRAGFSVPPVAYTLGRTRLEVFIYPSESAVAADVSKLDTVFAAPRGTRNPWLLVPTFARSGNLAAVYLTDNPTQAERFTLAITAGAPQP